MSNGDVGARYKFNYGKLLDFVIDTKGDEIWQEAGRQDAEVEKGHSCSDCHVWKGETYRLFYLFFSHLVKQCII